MQHNVTIQLDDKIYQPLMEKVGEKNLNQFISKLIEPYLLVNHQGNNNTHQPGKPHQTNNFDEVFGLLKTDKCVSLTEMDEAIRQRGPRTPH